GPGGAYGFFLLDGRTGQVVRPLGADLVAAGISADGRVVAGLRAAGPRAWNLDWLDGTTGGLVARVPVVADDIRTPGLAVAPDGRRDEGRPGRPVRPAPRRPGGRDRGRGPGRGRARDRRHRQVLRGGRSGDEGRGAGEDSGRVAGRGRPASDPRVRADRGRRR